MNLFFEKHLLWCLKINSLLVIYLYNSYVCFVEFLVVVRSIEIYSTRFSVITYKHSIYISTCFPFISSAHVSFCERRTPPPPVPLAQLPPHSQSDLSCADAAPRDKMLPSRINPAAPVTTVFVPQLDGIEEHSSS